MFGLWHFGATRLRDQSRWSRIGLYIFAVALAARLFALLRLGAAEMGGGRSGDIAFYHGWALRILGGEFTDGRAFYALPLYAYWLAGLYWLFGPGPFVPVLIQCAADAGTALLVFLIAERLISDRDGSEGSRAASGVIMGMVAALAWIFYLPAQAFAIVLMPTVLSTFVFWFLVWQIIKRSQSAPWPMWLWWGLLIGFTAMAVATILFVIPLFLGALVWKWRPAPKKRRNWALAAVLIVGVAIGTAPCWLHNTLVAKEGVFLSAHSGINFWIGNNPTANGYPRFDEIRAGQAEMLQDSVALAERAAGKPLKRGEVSAYWSAKARAYIANDFRSWIKLLARKIWNFWNAFQYDDLSVISKLREQGVIFPGLRFGLIAVFALGGLPFLLRSYPNARWVFAAVCLQVLALLPVFITERYRLAAVPGLVILAAWSLHRLWTDCRGIHLRRAATHVVAIGVAAALVSWSPSDPGLWALDPYNAGREALDAGHLALAEQKLSLAYAYVPNNPEINVALGNLYYALRQYREAERFYHATLELEPRHKSALSNLGVLALEQQNWEQAMQFFRAALAVEPRNAKSHYLLARALVGMGQRDQALAEIEIALKLQPAQPEFATLRQQILAGAPRYGEE